MHHKTFQRHTHSVLIAWYTQLGLMIGFYFPRWEYSIFYHHIFTYEKNNTLSFIRLWCLQFAYIPIIINNFMLNLSFIKVVNTLRLHGKPPTRDIILTNKELNTKINWSLFCIFRGKKNLCNVHILQACWVK